MFRAALLGLALLGAGCSAAGPLPAAAPVVVSPGASPASPVASPDQQVVFLAPRLDAPPAPASSPAPIGVAACDRYIALVDACPADASARQGGTRRLLEKDAPSWRETARSSTEGRLAVTFACQAALEGLRQKPCR